MNNELLFALHIGIVSLFSLGALKLGKEALIAFICLCCVLANLFVAKQILLCTFNATSSDSFTIGSVLGLNLLQEYFGKEIAKKALWINFFVLIFYTLMTQIHLVYIPSSCDSMQPHFSALLSNMNRIAIASLGVYFLVQYLDYRIYGFLKKKFGNRYLVPRNYVSVMVCQLIDTVLFGFLGLYGIIDNIGEVIVVSYIIKLVAILLTTPFLWLSRSIGFEGGRG